MNLFTNIFNLFDSMIKIINYIYRNRVLQIANLDEDDYELVILNE